MNRIELSKIMKDAWEIYKVAKCTTKFEFSVALKTAWAKFRNGELVNKVFIDNEITIRTIKKIVREHYYGSTVEELGAMNQTCENLDNGFITKEALEYIVNRIFEVKSKGAFLGSTKSLFGNRSRCRFVKNCFVELLETA